MDLTISYTIEGSLDSYGKVIHGDHAYLDRDISGKTSTWLDIILGP